MVFSSIPNLHSGLRTNNACLRACILIQSNKEQSRAIKMLILGAGESGKSTFLKQMITLYGIGFSEESRKKYKKDIHANAIESIRVSESVYAAHLDCVASWLLSSVCLTVSVFCCSALPPLPTCPSHPSAPHQFLTHLCLLCLVVPCCHTLIA